MNSGILFKVYYLSGIYYSILHSLTLKIIYQRKSSEMPVQLGPPPCAQSRQQTYGGRLGNDTMPSPHVCCFSTGPHPPSTTGPGAYPRRLARLRPLPLAPALPPPPCHRGYRCGYRRPCYRGYRASGIVCPPPMRSLNASLRAAPRSSCALPPAASGGSP